MFKDRSGHSISVGSYVVYSHPFDTEAELQFGKVVGLDPGFVKESGGIRYQERPSSVKIQGVEDTHNHFLGPRLIRPISIRNPGKILVIDKIRLSANARKLLESL